jgi:hypothetical protein
MLVIEKFNVKQGFLRKAAESVNNTGVHDVSLTKEGVSVTQSAPKPAAAPAASAPAASPFKMPSFAAKPPVGGAPSGGSGSGLFQKGVTSSPFGRPRAAAPVSRMPTFGRVVDKPQEAADDEIELRPYVPKKK